MTKVIVTGIGGKMGNTILTLALADNDIQVVGATEVSHHPLVGRKIGEIAGTTAEGMVTDNLSDIIGSCDTVIDFTYPAATIDHFRLAKKHKKAIVIGTTGFSSEALAEINLARGVKAVISPNMSVGMNLMFDVV